jgi:hypothetical protein
VLGSFTTVMIHTITFFAYRNTIFSEGKVIFVFEKSGDVNKKGIRKPYIYWLGDSERLLK